MPLSDDERPRLQRPRGGFRPVHGRRLDVENCSLDEVRARTDYENARTRNQIGQVVVFGSAGALDVTFVYGLWAGNLACVGYVWGVVAPLSAGVIGFYFRRDRKDV